MVTKRQHPRGAFEIRVQQYPQPQVMLFVGFAVAFQLGVCVTEEAGEVRNAQSLLDGREGEQGVVAVKIVLLMIAVLFGPGFVKHAAVHADPFGFGIFLSDFFQVVTAAVDGGGDGEQALADEGVGGRVGEAYRHIGLALRQAGITVGDDDVQVDLGMIVIEAGEHGHQYG